MIFNKLDKNVQELLNNGIYKLHKTINPNEYLIISKNRCTRELKIFVIDEDGSFLRFGNTEDLENSERITYPGLETMEEFLRRNPLEEILGKLKNNK